MQQTVSQKLEELAMQYICERCGARKGWHCTTPRGEDTFTPHQVRLKPLQQAHQMGVQRGTK